MNQYNIGPGVAQALKDNNDLPRSDENYVHNPNGGIISYTYGRDAIYYYYGEDNRVNRLPFERG